MIRFGLGDGGFRLFVFGLSIDRPYVSGNQWLRIKPHALREQLDETLAIDGGRDAVEIVMLQVIDNLHLHAGHLGHLRGRELLFQAGIL